MRSYLVSALFALWMSPALAGTICWLDHVSSAGGRMVLHFSSHAALQLRTKGKTFSISKGVATEVPEIPGISKRNGEGNAEAEISLALGEEADGWTLVEDACEYLATERDGEMGLLVTANNNAFGQHTTATVFLLPR